ncbi:MAG: M20/M25/M40 family metallo-hydrolase [Planctomycetes bacterium]|nr:M20/M25/M40 family metallo-hydrolase [Planctomycetota bacterium]
MRIPAALFIFIVIAAAGCRVYRVPPREVLDARFASLSAAARDDARAFDILTKITATKRLSGSDGAAKAVEAGAQIMRDAGFQNVHLEPVKVPAWTRRSESASIISGTGGGEETLRITALGGSPATPDGGITAEVVEVQSFDELHNLGDAAKGKIIFFNRPMDITDPSPFHAYSGAVDQRGRGGYEAKKAGAAAALVRSMTTRLDDHPHTGGITSFMDDEKTPVAPSAAVSTVGARKLHSLLKAGRGPVRIKLQLDCGFGPDVDSYNVIGEIPGVEKPGEIVLVGGHLDAWDTGFGAHDDGAGCAHSLEALRLLIQLKAKPARTIRCVLFINEENGLKGGAAYAAANDPSKHFFALESDSGGFDPIGFACTQKEPFFGAVRNIVQSLAPWKCDLLRPGGGGADISPLQQKGVFCGQFLPEPTYYFDFHHAETDTMAAIDRDELERGAAAIAYLLWAIADL